VAAQSVTATRPTPSLQERLDRLAAEIDRNRVDLHVPGAALANVRGDKVVFARGFGLRAIQELAGHSELGTTQRYMRTLVRPRSTRRFNCSMAVATSWQRKQSEGVKWEKPKKNY
jgi:CubicO group peptidase (beta-lactamase class C family)